MDLKDKEGLPQYSKYDQASPVYRRHRIRRRLFRLTAAICVGTLLYNVVSLSAHQQTAPLAPVLSLERLAADHAACARLKQVPVDPSGPRDRNARYVEGQKPILFRNATVWTGEPSHSVSAEDARKGKGFEWITADVLVEHGLIKAVKASISVQDVPADTEVLHLDGHRLTAGIVDMHSHAGVDTLPALEGSSDDNELSNDITPYVRSIDGINPLDPQLQRIKSGGVTTSLILPGSGNNIGGEAFVIKHAVGSANGRTEISNADLLADPEHNHRYMKMACGENAKRVYGRVGRGFGPFSRLGEAYYFRHAFEQAAKFKSAQDDWCAAADKHGSENMQSYLPTDLEWESLSAVLRGQVMVNTHCYTIPDLESFIGYSNEFNFSVRAFHHAHQTYLVPEVLKRVYGGRPPAAALFADNMNYKAESYIASEQAGKILWESGITPVYVSDNPVINAQRVLLEASKAFHNGVPYHVALAGVTSASAELLGLGERIGKVKAGFDADLVVWDEDPLSFSATPIQVFIDGTPQFKDPARLNKTNTIASLAEWKPRELATQPAKSSDLVLTGVTEVLLPGYEQSYDLKTSATVVIRNGSISCIGECTAQRQGATNTLDLINGTIAPPLTAFGSFLGLEEIAGESDTSDGANDETSFSLAIDGLALDGKNLLAAHQRGVTKAISAPQSDIGGHKGVSAGFRTGSVHSLAPGAVFRPTVALHYPLTHGAKRGRTPTLSSAVGALRARLLTALHHPPSANATDVEAAFLHRAATGDIPLVIDVHSADTIAALLRLKAEHDAVLASLTTTSSSTVRTLHLVILGGAESPLVAPALAAAKVPVILTPAFAFGADWEQRRALAGAPLDARGTAVDALRAAGVSVAFGVAEDWEARDLWTQVAIAYANAGGSLSRAEAVALASNGIYEILGLKEEKEADGSEFVVFEGDPLDVRSQVRAVADGTGMVSVWQ